MKPIFKSMKLFVLALLTLTMIGCGTIESNNVGVRTSWDGEINLVEVEQGFYGAVLSSVEEFSGKQITIAMNNMKPQAGDNLNLQDLDVEVYYTTYKAKIAELGVKYANRSAYDKSASVWYPAYDLVKSIARNGLYSRVGGMDSLDINSSRDKLAQLVMNETQAKLDASDPDTFVINKVIIRNVQVDPSIQDSIKINVAKDKELEAMTKQQAIAVAIAAANNALNASLTPAILRSRELDIQELAIKEGANLLVQIGGSSGAQPIVEVGQFMPKG
tara:strand:- start:86218 stop:87039 length:822 start_codon:yes stop_codon:yes gene_type:complete